MAVVTSVAVAAGPRAWAVETKNEMPYRTLGRTGGKVSAIGLGGYHIGVPKDEQEGLRIIRSAVDRGINFMDNCWDYHNGGSEIRMGKALRDGYRDKVFLMTKIDGRSKTAAAKQIDECLQRLQTDHIDLMQHHEIIRLEDPDRIFAEGGAHEAVLEAKKAGKIRYIGFTGHKDPLVHLRMLEHRIVGVVLPPAGSVREQALDRDLFNTLFVRLRAVSRAEKSLRAEHSVREPQRPVFDEPQRRDGRNGLADTRDAKSAPDRDTLPGRLVRQAKSPRKHDPVVLR